MGTDGRSLILNFCRRFGGWKFRRFFDWNSCSLSFYSNMPIVELDRELACEVLPDETCFDFWFSSSHSLEVARGFKLKYGRSN